MTGPVWVLAVMTEASRQLRAWQKDHGQDQSSAEAIKSLTEARAAVAELIEANRWRDPALEFPAHRARVLIAHKVGVHTQVSAATYWTVIVGEHDDPEMAWQVHGDDYVPMILAWRPLPTYDAALARCSGGVS